MSTFAPSFRATGTFRIFRWVDPAPVSEPDSYEPFNFKDVAPWIRGRIKKHGDTWFYEVVNTATGKVIESDNCNRFEIADLSNTVAVARGCWFYSLKQKDVAGHRSKAAAPGSLLSAEVH